LKALITGTGGFVGTHLARRLSQREDTELYGLTYLPPERYPKLAEIDITLQQADLTNPDAVDQILNEIRPDHIYHLAAQSFVPESYEDPWGTLSNNIRAQLNLLQTLVRLDLHTRLLVISSSEVYGAIAPEDLPVDEDQPLRPSNPYSVSKATQDLLGLQYYLSYDVPVIRVRPFNHIGPGQNSRFVAAAFASQIADIEAGRQEPVLRVGNLTAQRDFTDVRDVVAAYEKVIAHGQPGEVYNIGSGQAHSIQELLDILLHHSDAPITVREDPSRLRPVDIPLVVCDAGRLRKATGWQPTYRFEQTLTDILDEWRTRRISPAG
jgi:GDP-4-dehydro-6-deoxy-D-mannose reductase